MWDSDAGDGWTSLGYSLCMRVGGGVEGENDLSILIALTEKEGLDFIRGSQKSVEKRKQLHNWGWDQLIDEGLTV